MVKIIQTTRDTHLEVETTRDDGKTSVNHEIRCNFRTRFTFPHVLFLLGLLYECRHDGHVPLSPSSQAEKTAGTDEGGFLFQEETLPGSEGLGGLR